MANQIAVFFEGQGDLDAAVAAVRGHLQKFWDPRMRQEIAGYIDRGGGGLRPSALEAVRTLRARESGGEGTRSPG